jgi:hypothetical protein
MDGTSGTGAIQEFLMELSMATRGLGSTGKTMPHNESEIRKITDYAAAVRGIHKRIMAGHDPAEGSSRIIERFFSQWNNMVFGVFYSAEIAEKNKTLTSRQFKIFQDSVAEIVRYTSRFGAKYDD